MKPKLNRYQKDWLVALRSGEYEQATGTLCESDESDAMCCLGVLCDVVDPDRWSVVQNSEGDLACVWDEHESLPPDWVTDLVGVPHDAVGQLSTFNDINRWSFDRIADWLDSYWQGQVTV